MRSTVSSAAATLALGCAACEAFHVPTSAQTPQGTVAIASKSMRLRRGRLLHMEAASTAENSNVDTYVVGAADSDTLVGSYPGPVVPRVGGAMPEQRPGWFRVPAPGGKHTKVGRRECTLVAVPA